MIKFEKYNNNPKNKKTSDCVVRALSFATQKPYNQVIDELVEIYKKTGYCFNEKRCYEKYLEQNNFIKYKQPRKVDGSKYLVGEIDKLISKSDLVVISIANHLTAVNTYTLYDLWDCRKKSIGNFWVRV